MKLKGLELSSAVGVIDPDEIQSLLKSRTTRKTKSGESMIIKSATFSSITRSRDEGAPSYKATDIEALAKQRDIEWSDDHTGRVIGWWGSDERVDSDGDIVLQNWNFKSFESNPVMPWAHGWDDYPIGSALDWQVVTRKSKDYTGPALWILGAFPPAEVSSDADKAYRLAKAGILRGGSAGFGSKKVWKVTDPAERKQLGMDANGVILDENLLWEFSPCTVPANQGAYTQLVSAKSKKALNPEDVNFMRELARFRIATGSRDAEEWEEQDRAICAMAKLLFPKAEYQAHRDLDEPVSSDCNILKGYVSGAHEEEITVDQRLASIEEVLVGLSDRVARVEKAHRVEDAVSDDDDADFETLERSLASVNRKLGTLMERGSTPRKKGSKR